ncbi:cyclic nucleotide-binding domain-containing protein 2 isoform X2 [Nematostella vectensis]|uniref:cyclic nucleotide-binding domain-containing protein 2 isoform X2 n=1 Tax=Nematostella vectensis TaxID=45351 RepID=UPI002076E1BE|nr:cyclic nucleotide-binding domain-containing protein 2 isoform X2 [Nematostella vectensis]
MEISSEEDHIHELAPLPVEYPKNYTRRRDDSSHSTMRRSSTDRSFGSYSTVTRGRRMSIVVQPSTRLMRRGSSVAAAGLNGKSGGTLITLSRRRSSRGRVKEIKVFQPLEHFRHIIRVVRTILRVAKALKSDPKRDLGDGICKSFLEMMEGYMMMKNKAFVTSLPGDSLPTGPLLFDPTLFKANREIQISKEVKSILSLRPEERNTEQLQTVLYALQTMSSFAELPLHMQESVCKVAWHQSLPANKIIVKQGHLAENFYFIMSGSVTVVSENDPTSGQVFASVATLRRGASFGDLAILKNCTRTATVVSKDPIHLLVISREDYQRIFMGRSQDGMEPSHIKFCRTLDFLIDFPVDMLIDKPSNCMFHYFRRGTVIVKDSHISEWVYIVVSGTCEVMMELESATPRLKGKQLNGTVPKVEMLAYLTEDRFAKSRYVFRPNKNNKNLQNNISKGRSCFSHINTRHSSMSSVTPRREVRSASVESLRSRVSNSKSISLSDSSDTSRQRATTLPPVFPVVDNLVGGMQGKHSKKPVFVQIDVLHPRNTFGFANLDFEDTCEENKSAVVSLVSRGAECIMISKKFFMAHAGDLTKKWIRHNICPYPSQEILQRNLQQKVNWNAYKQEVISNFVSNKISTQG